jgi:hypothetical protein
MPIGATIGAAVIAGGATVASGALASHAQSKAASQASATELAVADKNNAFAQGIYDQNEGHLSPFIDFGTAGGGQLMELLTGKNPATASTGTTGGTGSTATPPAATGYTGPTMAQIAAMKNDGVPGNYAAAQANLSAWRNAHPGVDPFAPPPAAPAPTNAAAHATPATATATPAATGTTNAAQSAWDTFKNSTQYQERLNTGLNATASKYAAAGAFESGAEKKAINDYAQMFASNEIANYMDQLYRQEALGAQAASSLAGVGTSLVSQVSANNNNAASAAANAALVRGQGAANNWNNVGNAVGQIAGAVGGAMGSSYGGGGYDYRALQDSGIYDGTGAWDF